MAIVWDYVGSNVTNTMQQLSNYLGANWTLEVLIHHISGWTQTRMLNCP